MYLTKIMTVIFDYNDSGRLGERKKFVLRSRSTVKNKERGGSPSPPPPTPTVHFDTKSNMADGINDRELITIARPDETLALQATQ